MPSRIQEAADGEVVSASGAGRGHRQRRAPRFQHRGQVGRNRRGHDARDGGRQDPDAPAAVDPAHHFTVRRDLAGAGSDHHRQIPGRESRLFEREPRGAHREQRHAAHEARFRALEPEVAGGERFPVGAHQLAAGLAGHAGFVDRKGDLSPGLEGVAMFGDSGSDLGKQSHSGDDRVARRVVGEGSC